ncbi:MAG: hypothetical protein ACM3JF_01100 [Sphaerimonospora mesophila]
MVKSTNNNFTATVDQLNAAGLGATVSDIAEKRNKIEEANFYGQFIREARAGGWYDEDGALAGKFAEDLALYESYATQADYEALRAELKLDVGETATADVVELAASAEETLATVTPIADGTSRRVARRGGRLITRSAATLAGLALAGCSFGSGSTPTPAPSVPVSAAPSPSVSPSNTNTPTASSSPSPSVTSSEVPTTMTPNERDDREQQQLPQDKQDKDKAKADKLGVSVEDYKLYSQASEKTGLSVKDMIEYSKYYGVNPANFETQKALKQMRDKAKGQRVNESLRADTAKEAKEELLFVAYANPAALAQYTAAMKEDTVTDKGWDGLERPALANSLFQGYVAEDGQYTKKFDKDYAAFKKAMENAKVKETLATSHPGYSYMHQNGKLVAVDISENSRGANKTMYEVTFKTKAGVTVKLNVKDLCGQLWAPKPEPVVHKPSQPNKPYKPGKPNKPGKPKPPKKLEKKNQNQNLIRTNNPGSHDNSSDNANVNTNNDNKLQPREPDVDWNS